MRGGSKAVWNFSENSSVLVGSPVPREGLHDLARGFRDSREGRVEEAVREWLRDSKCIVPFHNLQSLIFSCFYSFKTGNPSIQSAFGDVSL